MYQTTLQREYVERCDPHPSLEGTMLGTKCYEIHRFLDGFSWHYPNGDDRGEVILEADDEPSLLLTIWVHDNADSDREEVAPLEVRVPVDPYIAAAEQVRSLIHSFLTHEADEQMEWAGPPVNGTAIAPVSLWHPHRFDPWFSVMQAERIAATREALGLD